MLIRKIKSIGCWDPNKINEKINRSDATIPGDTISDLKTDQNGLSVWYTPDLEEENIAPILAAIAVSRDAVQKVSYVVLEESELERMEIYAKQVDGLAPGITDRTILSCHHDLVDIDYKRLGILADYISSLIKAQKGKTKNERAIKGYINNLIQTNRIEKDSLKEGILKSI